MSSRPALDGEVQSDEVTRLKRELVGLQHELEEAKVEAHDAKQASKDAIQAIRAFRKACDPLYTAMKMIYGEISRVDAEAVAGSVESAAPGASNGKWNLWKSKLPAKASEFIDFLLIQPGMTVTQLTSAGHCDRRTTYRMLDKMRPITERQGDRIFLRES
jgi:hypothetical protein